MLDLLYLLLTPIWFLVDLVYGLDDRPEARSTAVGCAVVVSVVLVVLVVLWQMW
jgi:hypothetical protein